MITSFAYLANYPQTHKPNLGLHITNKRNNCGLQKYKILLLFLAQTYIYMCLLAVGNGKHILLIMVTIGMQLSK